MHRFKAGSRSSTVRFSPGRNTLGHRVFDPNSSGNGNVLAINDNTQVRMDVKEKCLGSKTAEYGKSGLVLASSAVVVIGPDFVST